MARNKSDEARRDLANIGIHTDRPLQACLITRDAMTGEMRVDIRMGPELATDGKETEEQRRDDEKCMRPTPTI